MPVLNPYLNFHDTCEQAFEFYKSVFGGDYVAKMTFKDMPAEYKPPGINESLILHVSLPVGRSSVLMGSDSAEGCGEPHVAGNNFSVSIGADSEEEARKIFDGLSSGGKVLMPLGKAFWGALFGMFIDKFGIQWMISYDDKQKQ